MLQLLERITAGKAELGDLDRLEELADTVVKGSLCGLGNSAPNPVLTTIRYFREEYEEHIEKGQCSAFVCGDLVRYWIDEERCTGCTACAKVCPVNAITGKKDELHLLDQELCTHCGVCRSSCPPTYAAIYRTSGQLKRYDEIQASKGKKEEPSTPAQA
jgi:NADH:ubiquinone oxidoreductase subunit F (NADH-binding)